MSSPPSFDAISEKGTPVACEEVVQVSPQLEEVERVATVSPDEIAGSVVRCAVRQTPWSGKGSEEQVPGSDDRREACHADCDRYPRQLVVECNRGMRPADEIKRVEHDLHPTRASTRPDPHEPRSREQDAEEGGGEQRRRAPAQSFVSNHERVAAPQQKRRSGPAERRLLDVEALENVQHTENDEQQRRHLPRSPATATQVECSHDQRDARRDRERVEQGNGTDGLQLEEHVMAPGDFGVSAETRLTTAEDDGRSCPAPHGGTPRGSGAGTSTPGCQSGTRSRRAPRSSASDDPRHRRLRDHARHLRVLLQPPQRVLVPPLAEGDVDPQRMARRHELVARPSRTPSSIWNS